MKNIKILLVFLVALFVIKVNGVNAIQLNDSVSLTSSGGDTGVNIYQYNPQRNEVVKTTDLIEYKYVVGETGGFAWCIDPATHNANASSLIVKEEITDSGILAILAANSSDYWATLIALRTYNYKANIYPFNPITISSRVDEMTAYENFGIYGNSLSEIGDNFKGSFINFADPMVSSDSQISTLIEAERLLKLAESGSGSNITAYLLADTSGGNQRYIAVGEPSEEEEEEVPDCPINFDLPTECVDPDAETVTGKIEEPSDIENCIVGNADRQNYCDTSVSNNSYCAVYCKEDYSEIRYSGAQDVNSGRYFQVTAKISGVKTCYADVDVTGFKSDISTLSARVEELQKTLASAPGNKSTAEGQLSFWQRQTASPTGYDQDLINANIANYQSAVNNWQSVIDTYPARIEETNKAIEKAFTEIDACSTWEVSFDSIPIITYEYDEEYENNIASEDKKLDTTLEDFGSTETILNCAGSTNSEYTSCSSAANDQTKITYTYCTTTSCETRTGNYSNAIHVAKKADKNIEYKAPEIFYNTYPNGNIIYGEPTDPNVEYDQIDGLPVSLTTDAGLHNFKFTISNLGEKADCTAGRFDEEDDFVTENEYVCYYKVNCPDCKPGVDITIPEVCPNCIFQFGIIQLYFRTISTDSFNPNDREIGYNFSVDDIKYGFISAKAEETLGGEGSSNPEGGILGVGDPYGGEPTLTVNLTPGLANEIRKYNDDNSSYANDTLTCEDYNEDHKNIFCYSNVLGDWADDYPEQFTFIGGSQSIRNDVNKYWTVFNEDLPVPGPTSVGGPSWK